MTLMFIDRPVTDNDVYAKLLSDKLPANLGYLYENLIAQMIAASGRELYYHTWEKAGSTHYYEVDFLISEGSKINAFEIKSSGVGKHESIKEFYRKFSRNVHNIYLLSQKDVGKEENLLLKTVLSDAIFNVTNCHLEDAYDQDFESYKKSGKSYIS